jgi:hypothetical protein
VYVFILPHVLHIRQPFYGFLGISSTHSSLRFDILLLPYLILLAFLMLILWVVGWTEKSLLALVIFLDLFFAGLLKNNLQLSNPPHRLSM